VGYSGVPPHAPGNPKHCIDPPPFGEQCTMHAVDALRACLALPGCASLTCPAPEPYVGEDIARRGISGPVCQARSVTAAAWVRGESLEAGHGMCAPSGCASAFLATVPAGAEHPAVAAAVEAAGVLAAVRARGGAARLVAVDAREGALSEFLGLGASVGLLHSGGRGGAWLLRDGNEALAPLRALLAPAGTQWAALPEVFALHIV